MTAFQGIVQSLGHNSAGHTNRMLQYYSKNIKLWATIKEKNVSATTCNSGLKFLTLFEVEIQQKTESVGEDERIMSMSIVKGCGYFLEAVWISTDQIQIQKVLVEQICSCWLSMEVA